MGRVLHPGLHLKRVGQMGRRIVWAGLDLVLPPHCGGCGAIGIRWCAECSASMARLAPPLCPHCGAPHSAPRLCDKCSSSPTSIRAVRSVAFFEGRLRNAIHRLKYRRDQGLADALAEPLARLRAQLDWRPAALIPVALSAARLAGRGYNQAELIARGLSDPAGIPLETRWLGRIRDTQSQTELNARERRQNVAGAFSALPPNGFFGARIALVDDVHTTGATLEACATAVMAAGAEGVCALTVARAR